MSKRNRRPAPSVANPHKPSGEGTFRVRVGSDRLLAKIEFFGKEVNVDANTVSTLIHHLASARMEMSPPISFPEPEGEATSVLIRNLEFRHYDDTGAIALILGHPGIGWVAYHFEPGGVKTLLDKMTSILAEAQPRKPPTH